MITGQQHKALLGVIGNPPAIREERDKRVSRAYSFFLCPAAPYWELHKFCHATRCATIYRKVGAFYKVGQPLKPTYIGNFKTCEAFYKAAFKISLKTFKKFTFKNAQPCIRGR